jgi:hypothetical protein
VSLNSTAVMQRRVAPAKGLDYFPTPPWATRAFMLEVLKADQDPRVFASMREPACGEGHMVHVLEEFGSVFASDVHDYGKGFTVGSYVGQGLDVVPIRHCGWVITNPPFNLAIEFAERALRESHYGVALLLRSAWMEGQQRYDRLFKHQPPTLIAQYAERVPMVAGRWQPDASSATAYAWFVWDHEEHHSTSTTLQWIKPGAALRHSRPDDLKRWSV